VVWLSLSRRVRAGEIHVGQARAVGEAEARAKWYVCSELGTAESAMLSDSSGALADAKERMSESVVPLAWMATGVSFLEVGDRQSNVVLKRIEVLVSEKFFDVPEICATADEFRRA
jgi:hypothetical protein